jgi:hypothetical protein
MSLLDTFRSLPTAHRKLGTLPRWMSGLKSRLPSALVSKRSPEVFPALAAVVLLIGAGLQITMPSSANLPDRIPSTPHRAQAISAEPDADAHAQTYPAILQRPIFAPDRAPVLLQEQTSGNLSGYEVVGTAIAGPVSAALVRDTTGRIVRVKPDAILQGWRLVSIDRTQLVFDRDGERRDLMVTATAPARHGPETRLGAAKASSNEDTDSDDSDNSDSDNSDNDDDN